jgi:hypothetical protein
MTTETTIALVDDDAWQEFAEANRDALESEYGSIASAYQHATQGGLTMGGGAAPLTRIYFEEAEGWS